MHWLIVYILLNVLHNITVFDIDFKVWGLLNMFYSIALQESP